jgi:signal transduction histidine kinase
MNYSMLSGLVLFALASYIPARESSQQKRLLYLLAELIAASLACAFGAYRLFNLCFLIIAGKSAILLKRSLLVVFLLLLYASHFASKSWANFAMEHIHKVSAARIEHLLIFRFEGELFFLCSLVAFTLCVRALMESNRNRNAIDELNHNMEQMAVALERSRIARDMHDSLGHTLTSLNIQLELTAKLLEDGENLEAKESLERSRAIARSSMQGVRKAIHSITAEDLSLKNAIVGLTEHISAQQDLKFELDLNEPLMAPNCGHDLFCIVQEALNNVRKHSRATQVSIKLENVDSRIKLKIEDNGVGIGPGNLENGYGLRGMRERIDHLGGTFCMDSSPGKGTIIEVLVPSGLSSA